MQQNDCHIFSILLTDILLIYMLIKLIEKVQENDIIHV